MSVVQGPSWMQASRRRPQRRWAAITAARLVLQQAREDRRAARRKMRAERARHQAKRPGENVGKDQVVGAARANRGMPPAIGQPEPRQPPQPVQRRILLRHAHRPGLDVAAPAPAVQQSGGRHRQDPRAGSQVQDAPRTPIGDAFQRPQAAPRRAMLA